MIISITTVCLQMRHLSWFIIQGEGMEAIHSKALSEIEDERMFRILHVEDYFLLLIK